MWKLMAKLVGVRELRRLTALFVLAAFVQGVTLALMIPLLRSLLGDRDHLGGWLATVAAFGIVSLALGALATTASYRISVYDICDALIQRLGERILALPLGWFDAAREAAVASAVSREVNTLSHISSIVIPALCNAFVVPCVMLVVVAFVDWQLALIMALAIPPMVWAWKLMRVRATEAHEIESQAAADSAGRLIEYARLQIVLRATGTTATGWRPLEDALAAEDRATQLSLSVKGRPANYFGLSIQVAFGLVMAVGLSSVLGDRLDAIAYLAIMTVTARMIAPLNMSILYATEAYNAEVALRAIDSIVNADVLAEPDPQRAKAEPADTTVEFADVTFGYDPSRPVVEGLSLRAEAGAMTALVGPSGAGKSTLLRLAARFWDVDGGSVSIGGVDVRDIPTRDLMSMTSMVFQEVYLFDTTIRENVLMARPDATREELEEAARRARLDVVVQALPDGWDTVVGQGGLKLSGGERQRVSIARAFIKDAPILLLDEITSALDGESEATITGVMRELVHGRTVIVVAHRLSTIRDADQVAFLQPGGNGGPARIVERGAPRDLAEAGGPYSDFVRASSIRRRLA